MPDSYTLRYGYTGVDQSLAPTVLEQSSVVDAVNAVIDGTVFRCRPGFVIHDLGLEDDANFQGAVYYNPAKGLSQKQFGVNDPSIVFSAKGKKFVVSVDDKSPENTTVTVSDVTGGFENNPVYHMVWMTQAENYIIAQDGNGETWIWDGERPPFHSSGYDSVDKENSQLANAASVVAYAHGRIVQVVNGKQILVGDIIHKDDLTSAENILGMTEQVYWATGSFFSPPSSLGSVMAAAVLPLRNTIHGHADLMLHCEDGVFSLDLTKFPREDWINESLVKHAMLDTGASGFYAITLYDSDQIFLSRHGVQTLRSAAAESNILGNALRPISDPVRDYIETDTPRYYRYASVEKFVEAKRLFCTTAHEIFDAKHRGGRGLLVINFYPIPDRNESAWEGLWTLPHSGRLVNQMVSGLYEGRERVFAFVTGGDGVLRLAEFSKKLPYDVEPDGTIRPIKWQIKTRRDTAGDEMMKKSFENVSIMFRDVVGRFGFTLYAKTDQTDWKLFAEGCLNSEDGYCLVPTWKRDIKFEAGAPPQELKQGLWIQFLLKMEGCASVESIKVKVTREHGGESSGSQSGQCIVLCEQRVGDTVDNPFEYNDEQ